MYARAIFSSHTITKHPVDFNEKPVRRSRNSPNRDVKNIAMDVKCLAQVGLVEKRRSKDEKKDITPSVNYERIIFEINV